MAAGPDNPRSASAPKVGVYPAPTSAPPGVIPASVGSAPVSPPPGRAYPVAGERPPTTPHGAPRAADEGEGVAAPYVRHFKDSLAHAKVLLGEIREYGTHYGLAKLDKAAFAVRTALVYAALGVIGAVVGLTALVYATALLLGGLSTGIGILLGNRPWLGALIVGAVVLVGAGVGAYLLGTSLIGKSRKALQAKYEGRRQQQREAFGRDVATAAAASDTRKGEDRAG